jgi:arylsulfatase A-like enzyme
MSPNVVILLIDDYPAMDNRVLERLPNIKELFLDQGVSFTNTWANYSLCCPARASVLTGQRASHHKVLKNDATLFDPTATLATALQNVGYHTLIAGKYFNGTWALADKTPPGWDSVVIKEAGPYYRYRLWLNGVREYHGSTPDDYSTDVVAGHAMAQLRLAPDEKPLFAFLTPNAPHGDGSGDGFTTVGVPLAAPRHQGDPRCADIPPWRPASYNEADVSDKPKYIRQLPLQTNDTGWPLTPVCESLLAVDEWMGQVVDELRTQGRYRNTLFMLVADNGMAWGAHRMVAKTAPHTAQIPMHASWPAMINDSTLDRTLLSNVDIAPTICEIAGCELGPFDNGFGVDGQSFAGLVAPDRFESVPNRDSIILEGGPEGPVPFYQAIMTGVNHPKGAWFFIRYPGLPSWRELYQLGSESCVGWSVGDAGDPCMLTNQASRYVRLALRRSLSAELTAEW